MSLHTRDQASQPGFQGLGGCIWGGEIFVFYWSQQNTGLHELPSEPTTAPVTVHILKNTDLSLQVNVAVADKLAILFFPLQRRVQPRTFTRTFYYVLVAQINVIDQTPELSQIGSSQSGQLTIRVEKRVCSHSEIKRAQKLILKMTRYFQIFTTANFEGI